MQPWDRLGPERVLWEQEPEAWAESMRINLDGPFFLSRAVLKGMVDRGYGRLVYTSSTSAEVAEHAGSAYNSSKAGLLGLMRSVAQDAGAYGVTSNAVLPGWVRTPMADLSAEAEARDRGVTTDQVWAEREALYAAGRVVSPEEVASHRLPGFGGVQRRERRGHQGGAGECPVRIVRSGKIVDGAGRVLGQTGKSTLVGHPVARPLLGAPSSAPVPRQVLSGQPCSTLIDLHAARPNGSTSW